MTWFEDLSECDYFGLEPAVALRAVGWLERGRPFKTGAVDPSVYRRLCELRRNPWQPVVSPGLHECDLCQYEGATGSSNIFVPGSGILYVCPELVTHYMNVHGYAPPDEFCRAVLACPPMRSISYLKAILANGGRLLVNSPDAPRGGSRP